MRASHETLSIGQEMTEPRLFPNDLPFHATSQYLDGRIYSPPRQEVIDAFLTIVAKFSKKYDVGIAAWALMGSHPHLEVFDRHPERDKPSKVWLFRQQVNACFAKWLNNYWDTGGQIFSASVVSQLIPIVDARRASETVGYIETNPVQARLVNLPEEMPLGAVSLRSMAETPLVVRRPDDWFRPQKWDDFAILTVEMPPLAERDGYDRETWLLETTKQVRQRTLEILMAAEPGEPAGVAEILAKTPSQPRSKRSNYAVARFSGTDKVRLSRLYASQRAMRRVYRRAKDRVALGEPDVVFPWGTGRMVVSFGFKMAPG